MVRINEMGQGTSTGLVQSGGASWAPAAGQRHPGPCQNFEQVTESSCHSLKMLSLKLPRLFRIDQVPQVFHEQGILFGYRHPQSSATACVLSLFQMTNETLNIWTHLLPFCFFTWRFVTALYVTDIWNDSYSWPLFVYMGTSCVYPLASSCAHTFNSMSKNARHICYFLDYGAVNLFSLGSAIAYSAYSIPNVMVNTTFHDYYVPLAVLNTIISTGLSCYSRLGFAAGEAGSFAPGKALYQAGRNVVSSHGKSMVWGMAPRRPQPAFLLSSSLPSVLPESPHPGLPAPSQQRPHRILSRRTYLSLPRFLEIQKPGLCKMLRVLAFAYPYTWDSLPIFYRLFLLSGDGAQNEAALYHQKHTAMTLLASFFYSAHLPERLAPGRFDYIGHSHQLFHVCVILATHLQMEAIVLDKTLRREWLLANSRPLSFPQIAGAVLLCLIFSLSNIIYFSAALYRIPEPELHKKET
ncbi:membrane progestin receptor gamma isoform X1 [Felis catus]|uniref:Progestin and adipoQ receptor family member 5 n=3 Tax=Felis catus TaxID=9685 RepID=A0ABI7Y090_FELCA|nr:membrane progestin receptor gamma isoform X1 [Felis catus]XP_044915038.1 membrane progestin receptor gamma isoform X1 [Felis catus]XP_044915039.1 membrane progestin receptor gamma isoform X1 [Felis catus]